MYATFVSWLWDECYNMDMVVVFFSFSFVNFYGCLDSCLFVRSWCHMGLLVGSFSDTSVLGVIVAFYLCSI